MKKRFLFMGLAAVVAVSSMSIGFASWKTDAAGTGKVSASGKWDISVTDAALETSAGTEVSVRDYAMKRTSAKEDSLIAATICISGNAEQSGSQSTEPMSDYVGYYAVDTSKYSLEDLQSFTDKSAMDAVKNDKTTLDLDRYLNAYYRHFTGDPAYSNKQAAKVVDSFLSDSTALLKEKFPETYANYMIVYLSNSGGWGKFNYTIASMGETILTGEDIAEDNLVDLDGANVNFADVSFQIPDSWAAYTITVTNNGTTAASLENADIYLDTEDKDQLTVDVPSLSGEVLEPGDSCTVTAVVKALDDGSHELDASGSLVIHLPYGQETVEPAPSASHIHTK